MKNHRKTIGIVLLFLIGLSILLYPTISNRWNEYRAQQLISSYDTAVASASGKDQDYSKMLAETREYNEKLTREVIPDAFSIRDGVKDETYESLLNPMRDGMMGYLEIPVIKVKSAIYHYTTEEVLKKGIGHLFGSSLPVGGENTHAIVSAHRGLPSAKLFTDLDLVEKGDVFYIHVLDEILAYKVDQILVVEPDETESLGIEEGKDYVTLVTCTPYAVNSHRILVRGHRIPYDGEVHKELLQDVSGQKTPDWMPQFICVLIGCIIAVGIAVFINRKELMEKRKRKNEAKNEETAEEEKSREEGEEKRD